MARILFWNLCNLDRTQLIVDICELHDIDTCVFAEASLDLGNLEVELYRRRRRNYYQCSPQSARVKFLSVFGAGQLTILGDAHGISCRELIPPIGIRVNIVGVHLPSKMNKKEQSQIGDAIRLATKVKEIEQKSGHDNTIIIGDFNMDPFEWGIVGVYGLHAVMDRTIASRRKRIVTEGHYPYFYNPMWSRIGDHSAGPPGTYFKHLSEDVSYFWNTFDQLLVRPSLLGRFQDSSLHVLESVGQTSLLSKLGRPNPSVGSDHLPLIFEIDIK